MIGGVPSAPRNAPAVVALVDGDLLCTGALVSPTQVLTAGHCVDAFAQADPALASLRLHFGANDVEGDLGVLVGAVGAVRAADADIGLVEIAAGALVGDAYPTFVPWTLVEDRGDWGEASSSSVGATAGFGVAVMPGGEAGRLWSLSGLRSAACESASDKRCLQAQDDQGACFGDSGAPVWRTEAPGELRAVISAITNPSCTGPFTATPLTGAALEFLASHGVDVIRARPEGSCSAAPSADASWLPLLLVWSVLVRPKGPPSMSRPSQRVPAAPSQGRHG